MLEPRGITMVVPGVAWQGSDLYVGAQVTVVVLGPRGIRQCCPLQLLICSQVLLHCLAHVTLTKYNYHTYLIIISVYQVDGKYQGY